MAVRNLKDNSKKHWLCECYPNGREGKRVRKRFATKGEAVAYELYLMKEIDDKPWLGDKPDHRRLSELVDLWYELHGKKLKSGAHTKGRMEHVIRGLGNPIATQLDARKLAHYRAARKDQRKGKEGSELAISSSNRDMTCLKAVFNRLIELKEWRFPNPLDGMKNHRVAESELTFLHEPQIIRLFETLKGSEFADELRLVYMICLSTGARISEALLLQGKHVFDNKITFVNTKGKRNRTLPISEALYLQLKPQDSGHLFSCSYKTAHKWVNTALPELPAGQSTHVLRHTFATTFMRKGGNILDLREALGHTNIEQTMIYAHFSPNHLSSVAKLNPIANLNI
ncbi:tyrosine-type recombinase/integrase [Vibrio scophthalmi]|uniref:Integrase n=1 Tax=Vibrio scophthalmi TaxID=45658 RepID=A0A1C7FA05_9VIBR|nr:tyrosine-type recombinase/integrase [Vibrio scophthalmi]ANU36253.1 Integrase [Vibrio scophthalmi]